MLTFMREEKPTIWICLVDVVSLDSGYEFLAGIWQSDTMFQVEYMRRQKILVYFTLGDCIKINNDVMRYDPFNQIKIHKSILEVGREEKVLPQSKRQTNKYRRNDGLRPWKDSDLIDLLGQILLFSALEDAYSVSGLYLLDASNTPLVLTTKNISRHCQMFSAGRNHVG